MLLLVSFACTAPPVVPASLTFDRGPERVVVDADHLASLPGVTVVRRQPSGGFVAWVDDRAAARRVLSLPGVRGLRRDVRHQAALTDGLDAIGQPQVEAMGYRGAGATIVLLDSGVDPAGLGCGAAGEPGCALVASVDAAPDDGLADDSGHGTQMAKIVHAVAPDAELVSLDVFDGDVAWESDFEVAYQWVLDHVPADQARVLNRSTLTVDPEPSAQCGSLLVDALLTQQVAPLDGFGDSANLLDCMFDEWYVGAVYPADVGRIETPDCTDETTARDQVACFSPVYGAAAYAPGVVVTDEGEPLVGLSVASAYAAGAMAVVLASGASYARWDAQYRLERDGRPVVDPRQDQDPWGVVIDLPAALETCAWGLDFDVPGYLGGTGTLEVEGSAQCEWSITSDQPWIRFSPSAGTGPGLVTWTVDPNPTGAERSAFVSQVHTSWAPGYEVWQSDRPWVRPQVSPWAPRSLAVTVMLTADPGAVELCLSNDATCSAWIPYQTSVPWTLTPGATGDRRVTAWVRGADGVESDPASYVAKYDVSAPTGGRVTFTPTDTAARLAIRSFQDVGSGIRQYRIAQATGTAAPSSCPDGSTSFYDHSNSNSTRYWYPQGLTAGQTYAWRVCAVDAAGNVSSGATTSGVARAEYVRPAGTVALPAASRVVTVPVTLSATDNVGVTEMCLATIPVDCTGWRPFATDSTWTFTGTGSKALYATFRDAAGNVSDAMVAHTNIDTTAPTGGTLLVTPDDQALDLAWSGATDVGSGVVSHRVSLAAGAPPAAGCTSPTWTGTETTWRATGLVNGTSYGVRVCAVDAAGNVAGGITTTATPVPERIPPTGTLVLAGGADWTRNATITATLAASDDSGVTHACLSNTSTCTAWFAMTPSKSWTLTSGAGAKTVQVRYKDSWGNVSDPIADTIGVDATAPANGTVTAAPGDGTVTLTWSGQTETGSGLVDTIVVQSSTGAAPANCNGAPVWTGTGTTYTATGLTNGSTYSWRVCATDAAGNRSVGATVASRPAPEFVPPTGTVTLAGGATWTASSSITASLTATDDAGVTHACLSNTSAPCTAWFAMTPSKTWTLASGAGTKSVYASFKDTWGNVSAPVSDAIQVDATPPSNGTVSAVPGDGQVTLSWTGQADTSSGLADYVLVQAASATAPASCAGASVWTGTTTSTTVSALTNGTTYSWRLCARDVAGNRAAGATTTSRPAPEFDPPTGTVVAAGGASWTRTPSVTLDLTATDPSGVPRMCVSTTTTCTTFRAFATPYVFTLPAGDGPKTVRVWLQDTWNNTALPVTDEVGLDVTAPTNGVLAATATSGGADLTLTSATDTRSGIVSYAVVSAPTTAPTRCTSGTVVWTGATPTAAVTGLPPGVLTGLRMCATDAAGNQAVGAATTVTPLP